ncbi:MAG TPA: glycosyl hydrolase family 79 C-terminal domain-containing protein [Rugosimonospora sp.]|nr:glycosyl hydrolase family 79 C-terminal domain-containing protein [Rugosimonospora sp.]
MPEPVTGAAARRWWRRYLLVVSLVCLATLAAAVGVAVFAPARHPGTARTLAPLSTVVVTVDASRTAGVLPATVLGLSYEADELALRPGFEAGRGNLANLMRGLGTGYLKVGANAVDDYVIWNPDHLPVPPWAKTSIGPPEIDVLAGLAQATGWRVELGVNLARFDAPRATAEAQYATARLGALLAAVECGNEPNGYAGRVRPAGYGYADYRAEFEACADAVTRAGAPLAGPNTYAGAWIANFARDEHDRVVLLTDQPYALAQDPARQPTLADLLSPATAARDLRLVDRAVAVARAYHLPLRRDETNSVNQGGLAGVSDVYGSALWALDYTLRLAQHGVSGLNFHGTAGLCGRPETDGKVRHYTPLCAAGAADLAAGVLTPQPVYYGLLMAHLLGAGEFLPVTVTGAGSRHVDAYAVRGADGRVRVLVVNADPAAAALRLDPGTGHAAEVLHLTGESLDSSAGIAIQGRRVNRDGTFTPGPPDRISAGPGGFTLALRPASATLVTVTG